MSKYAGNLWRYACKALWDSLTIIDTLSASCSSLLFSPILLVLVFTRVTLVSPLSPVRQSLWQLVTFCQGKTASKFCSHHIFSRVTISSHNSPFLCFCPIPPKVTRYRSVSAGAAVRQFLHDESWGSQLCSDSAKGESRSIIIRGTTPSLLCIPLSHAT